MESSDGVPLLVPEPESAPTAKFQSKEGLDYSTTNIQVKNVDEPDFIKNDGKHLYILVGNELVIVEAYPAESAEIVFESDFDIPNYHNYENMFLNEDRLAIIYQDLNYKSVPYDLEQKRSRAMQSPVTNVMVLNISDRSEPQIINEYSIDGRYHDSRMIKENVYVITKDQLEYNFPIIPHVQDLTKESSIKPDVYYFEGLERPSVFTTISAIGLKSSEVSAETYLLGSSDTIYVSDSNIYLTILKHHPSPKGILENMVKTGLLGSIIEPLPKESQERIKRILEDNSTSTENKWYDISLIIEAEFEKLSQSKRDDALISYEKKFQEFAYDMKFNALRTLIHKIAILDTEKVDFDYVASAEVLGHVLNQFSMDEFDGKFRVATSVPSFGGRSSSEYNNVYILDESLNLVGSLEEIAPQEKIYSARFLKDKLFLVTFRQIDPFFVIDLSENTPKILGDLKIPGFSNYLHPYGEDHMIGIGIDVGEDGIIRSQNGGVKIAMFDISEFDKPKVKDQIIIGKSGTWSPGLDDHKAILIDERKNILSIPILHESYTEPLIGTPEETDSDRLSEPPSSRIYPYYDHWNGFYVYGLDKENGFEEIGKIRHETSDDSQKARTLYIEDMLYTVSDYLLNIHHLDGLEKIKALILN